MAVIFASAPGRCGIVGNPSDMYGGNVVSTTVRERAEVELRPGPAGIRITNSGQDARLLGRDDLVLSGDMLDIARAALTYFEVDPAASAFELSLRTDIPMRAGLAGSTAMLAALVGALDAHLGLRMHRYALAETTRKIEARVLGIVCGLQDQHMAVFGGLNYMAYPGKEMLEQRNDEPYGVVEPLAERLPDVPLLLAHTGVEHNSGAVHRSPRERWLAGDPVVRAAYRDLAELAWRAKRALLERDWPTVGDLMNVNHRTVAELGGSGPDNDRLIAAALAAGAWGAKLAGAGGGGTIVLIAEDPAKVGEALMAAGADRLLHPGPWPGLTVTSDDGSSRKGRGE